MEYNYIKPAKNSSLSFLFGAHENVGCRNTLGCLKAVKEEMIGR